MSAPIPRDRPPAKIPPDKMLRVKARGHGVRKWWVRILDLSDDRKFAKVECSRRGVPPWWVPFAEIERGPFEKPKRRPGARKRAQRARQAEALAEHG
jgi:hypothetical protein